MGWIYYLTLFWLNDPPKMAGRSTLCEDCFNESQKDKPIWCMDKVYGTMSDEYIRKKDCVEYVEQSIDKRYKYDKKMTEYINELPLESQELVYNTYGKGALAYHMNPQDWIDFKLGILPHEVCAEYDLYHLMKNEPTKRNFLLANILLKLIMGMI